MMRVIITPGPLKGELDAIPSKSDAHRAVLAAALSDKPTDLILPALSQDIEATVACVAALGAAVVRTQTGLRITPRAQDASAAASLFFGESGTTARLVLPVAAALCERVEAGGAGRLPARPMAALCRALSENGCRLGGDRLPLSLRGPLQAGVYELPGNISSQYVSGLLFALPLLEGDSVVALTSPLQSSGYVDMTIQTLAAFGIEVCARRRRLARARRAVLPFSGRICRGGRLLQQRRLALRRRAWRGCDGPGPGFRQPAAGQGCFADPEPVRRAGGQRRRRLPRPARPGGTRTAFGRR